MWPPSNFISLSTDEHSIPDENSWTKQACKVVGRAKKYKEAEDVVNKLEMMTDSEDALEMTQGTRGRPAKKKTKFEVKSYDLAPPKIKTIKAKTTLDCESDTTNRTPEVGLCPATNSFSLTATANADNTTIEQENEPPADDYSSSSTRTILHQPAVPHISTTQGNLKLKGLDVTDGFPVPLKTSVLVDNHQAQPIIVPFSQGFVPGSAEVGRDPLLDKASALNNMDQQNSFVGTIIDGRQYISLGNGCFMEVVSQSEAVAADVGPEHDLESDIAVASAPIPMEDGESDSAKILRELQRINSRLDGVEKRVDQLIVFSASMDKFMSTKQTSAAKKRPEPEDFTDIRQLWPLLSEDELLQLEQNLKNKPYADKLFRYFDSEYNLNGKREGKSFFKNVVRKIIAPTLLQPFSWTGCSRKSGTDESAPFTPNRSFRDTFPSVVQFVQRITCAADMDHTLEDTASCFSLFLRQKRTEMERFLSDNPGKRAAGCRTRKPREAGAGEDSGAGENSCKGRQQSVTGEEDPDVDSIKEDIENNLLAGEEEDEA
nr:uncharacterized protein LOC115264702 [Aedes albopictus]